jgi:hypothetical protein
MPNHSVLRTNVPLSLALASAKAKIILGIFTVRVHTRVSRYPWARLWYLCRGLDVAGKGWITLPLPVVQSFLDCSDKSAYRWLQQGQKVGAFRKYRVRAGVLTIWLGSLFVVCRQLNLRYWGAVSRVPMADALSLIGLRASATGIVTQKFQQKSRYAANHKLKPEYRKLYGAPDPNELFGDIGGQSSHKKEAGQLPPCVLHISDKRIWASKSFTHFGASQHSISCELGIHKRTVRRHQRLIDMERRQLCQKRRVYSWIKQAWENDSPEYYLDKVMLNAIDTGSDTQFKHIGYTQFSEKVAFTDGVPMGARKQTPNKWDIPKAEFGQRFFKMGDDTWINRCNIYRETYQLTTMRAARNKYRQKLANQGLESNCHKPNVTVVEKIEPPLQATISK